MAAMRLRSNGRKKIPEYYVKFCRNLPINFDNRLIGKFYHLIEFRQAKNFESAKKRAIKTDYNLKVDKMTTFKAHQKDFRERRFP